MSSRVLLLHLVTAVLVGLAPASAQEPSPDEVNALYKQAHAKRSAGDATGAATLYERVLKESPRVWGEGTPEHANVMNQLGLTYLSLGKHLDAEPLLKRALTIREEKLGKDHRDTATSLNNLGACFRGSGRNAEAEEYYRRALAVYEKAVGKDHPDYATGLTNLAGIARETGRIADAEAMYRRALEIREAKLVEGHNDIAAGLNNLAALLNATSRHAEAEPLLRRALAIREKKLGADHPGTATSLNNLALLLIKLDKHAEAQPMLEQALAIREKRLGDDHPDTGISLNNLAHLYQAQGKYTKAEAMYRKALAVVEARLGKDHPDAASLVNNLALSLKQALRPAEAEPLFRRSLATREKRLGENHPDTIWSFNNLAALLRRINKPADAADLTDRARIATRRHASQVLPVLGEQEQLRFFRDADGAAYQMALSLALRHPATADLAGRSAAWVVNAKGVAEQSLARANILARDGRDPNLAGTVRDLGEARRQLARLALETPKAGEDESRRRRLDEAAAKEAELAKRLKRLGGTANEGDPWVPLDAVRKALPAKGVFIDFARFDEHDPKAQLVTWKPARYAAWVTPKAGPTTLIDLGPAEPIDKAVADVRKALEKARPRLKAVGEPGAEKEVRAPLTALAKLVLDPLRAKIDAADGWVISPDGQLWLAPWAALPLDDATYAVEKHSVRLVVSGRDLLPKTAAPRAANGPAIFADPDFNVTPAGPAAKGDGTRSLGDFKLGQVPRLPDTAGEAEEVAEQLKKLFRLKPAVFTEAGATTSAFRKLDRPRMLTLATHGYFLPTPEPTAAEKEQLARDPSFRPAGRIEDPLLRCGLLLAGCNTPSAGDTGVLTGREVLSADLRGCELVVLSACETGLGDVRQGEGVAGLRQAFMLAGAESVLASLWKVPDLDTAILMAGLFDGLGNGRGRAEALAATMRQRIAERRDKFGAAHPYFWAAFTLTGDAGPIGK